MTIYFIAMGKQKLHSRLFNQPHGEFPFWMFQIFYDSHHGLLASLKKNDLVLFLLFELHRLLHI